jgi:PEP-CTERM motif
MYVSHMLSFKWFIPRAIALIAVATKSATAAIVLTSPTGTFSQASLPVSETIDGDFSSGLNGWAIDPNEVNQTAVYEIPTNPAGPNGAGFTFYMHQLHSNPQHTLGRFRFSVTGDDPSTFADGLQSGGDVTATWTPVTPLITFATGGAILTVQGDMSILASGPNPSTSVYTIVGLSSLTSITGLRLEVLEDPSLQDGGPGEDGPGRKPTNGNFVLTELQVDATSAVPEPATFVVFGVAIALAFHKRRLISNLLNT